MESLGWTSERAAQLAALDRPGLVGARVASAHRGRLDLLGPDGPLAGRVAGRLRHIATSPADLPAVGDWVAVDPGSGVVHAVLPRHGGIARADPGGQSQAQVLAANVDVALLVGSLNRDLSIRRFERLLALAADARAEAVVVLSKADLVADPWARVADVRLALGSTVPVIALSVHAGTGLDALGAWLRPGATAVLLGSSGAGKTTLLNALSGGPPRRTAEIRASDDRGRHATTVRELVPLPSGAIVIDTPGLRLPRVWEEAAGLDVAFADIAELARRCRFADCRHNGEPGCAVAGAVSPERLAGLKKLERERERIEARRDARARAESRRSGRATQRAYREALRAKGR
ncbi:MAG TPA: ribosome small subunit-dependent GTPase A [Solirubrobacteraceae bacterium]|nr:ribosome small subunit-dependent GTPase A [Solirubrobacteraceae bacterium]